MIAFGYCPEKPVPVSRLHSKFKCFTNKTLEVPIVRRHMHRFEEHSEDLDLFSPFNFKFRRRKCGKFASCLSNLSTPTTSLELVCSKDADYAARGSIFKKQNVQKFGRCGDLKTSKWAVNFETKSLGSFHCTQF